MISARFSILAIFGNTGDFGNPILRFLLSSVLQGFVF